MKLAVIGGVLTVAIADAFSDSLGIHIAEETSKRNGHRAVWEATIATFLTKFIVASSFLIALLIFELPLAVKINIIWGFLLLIIFNYILAKKRGESPLMVVSEHILIAAIVSIITFFVGKGISTYLV